MPSAVEIHSARLSMQRVSFNRSALKTRIDTLVDMGALNFDESMPLKGIVKMLKVDSAKGITKVKG